MCSDAWHWFDGARAADELARVVRPGGGVVVCVTYPRWHGSDDAPDWWLDLGVVHTALPKGDHPALVSGWRQPDVFEGHPAFEEMQTREVPFVHHTDRDEDRRALGVDVVRRVAARAVSAPSSSASSTGCSRVAASTRSTSPTGPSCGSLGAGQRQRRVADPRGSGELTSIGAPVTGCAKASRAACRNWRSSPRRPGVPYSGSPTTG